MTEPQFTLAAADAQDGGREVKLGGRLTLQEGAVLWPRLNTELQRSNGQGLTIDLSGVEHLDGGAAALLQEARAEAMAKGKEIELKGASKEAQRLLEMYECPAEKGCLKEPPEQIASLDQIGRTTVAYVKEVRAILGFFGDLLMGIVAAVRRPRSVHWRDLWPLMERSGADGLPIIGLMNLLVGMVLGLQGAIQLKRYGGDVFLAYLVGLSVVRELAPLLTAVLVTGRSGAAFAAELGTMHVNEEVDALRTLGQDPQRFLVLPRFLAMVVIVPMLTVLADIIGCLGGLVIAVTYQDQSPATYLNQLNTAIHLKDVLTGLLKSVFFAGLIALVACERGLAARGGAEGVGRSTTSAVVIILFGLVVIDSAFAIMFTILGW